MAMTAAELQEQALSWLRRNPGQRCCQHHWAQASGLTSPEDEQALGGLLRTIRANSKKFPGIVVTEGLCTRCATTSDNSDKTVIQSLAAPTSANP